MPYGDLAAQAVQRFETYDDLEKHEVTIEEREEYEPHIAAGRVVYAGVDYEAILRQAEQEADVVIWDGGNNDLSFYEADLYITVVDSHRPDHSARYHPGEANVRLADVIVINKVGTASLEQVQTARAVAHELNPDALVIEAASPLFVEGEDEIRGKKVLVVEDGPTLTHGEMAYGAGWVAALRYGAEVSEHWPCPARDGIRGRANGRAAADDRRHAGGSGRHRHTDRPPATDRDRQAVGPRTLRVAGDWTPHPV